MGSPCLLGSLLGQRGLEKLRFYSLGVHECWLAHQSGQRPAPRCTSQPKGANAPPTPHHHLEPDLGQTDPGRGLPGTQLRSPEEAQPPDACSHSALALSPSQILITTQPPPSLALRLGWTQRRKVHELGRLLSSTRDSGTGDVRVHTGLLAVAVTSFGAGHALKGNRA